MKTNLEIFESSDNSNKLLFEGSVLDMITQNYLNKVIDIGEIKEFGFEDLFSAGKETSHANNHLFALEVMRMAIDEGKRYDLISHIRSYLGFGYYLAMGFQIAASLGAILIPVLIKAYLTWFQIEEYKMWEGYLFLLLLVSTSIFQTVTNQLSKKQMGYCFAKISIICKVDLLIIHRN